MATCAGCSRELSGAFAFCPFCGAQLGEAAAPARETRKVVTVESLKSLQADDYGKFIWEVRDGLFPHWGRTFLGQNPEPQGALNGMIGHIYRRLDKE